MMRAWIRLPSPAMCVALIALAIATSGTTYAAIHIGTKQIRDNAVTSSKIRNGAVKNVDLARNSVVTAKIVASAVTGLQIKDGSVGGGELANDSVTSNRIRDGAVGTGDLANGAVTGPKLRAGAVGASSIADSSIGSAKIADGSIGAADIKDGEVVKGSGRIVTAAVTLPDGASATPLVTAPGLGVLRAGCAAGVATTQWANTASTSVVVVNQVSFHDTAVPAAGSLDLVHQATVAAGAATDQPPNIGSAGIESVVWQASVDDPAGDRAATITVTASASGTGCRLTAQGFSTL